MGKMLVVDYSRCTGCRLCEVACSLKKHGTSNASLARLRVVKWEPVCLEVPMVCQQCNSAPCMMVCPVQALEQDDTLGRIKLDEDRCIGCKFCVAACPFGAMGVDAVARRVIKCDLCDGEPACVHFCETQAIKYVDAGTVNLVRMREAAQRISELIRKYAVPESA